MKRLVSYIYKYNDGKKGENVGYGKIDTADNKMKINISLRCTKDVAALKVYFFVKEEKTKLIYIGDAVASGNMYELRMFMDIGEATKDKYKTLDIYGLAIGSEEKIFYISYWKEEYEVGECEMWDENRNEITEQEGVNNIGNEVGNAGGNMERERVSDESISDESVSDESVEVIEEDTIYLIDRNCIPVDDGNEDERIKKESVDEHISISQFFNKNMIKEIMLNGESRKICKIKPKDIYVLPRKCWSVVRNAYVCHGFMRYGQVYLVEEEGIYIGVCGYKNINEEIVAKKYGFNVFMSGEVEEVGESSNPDWERGLWCRRI